MNAQELLNRIANELVKQLAQAKDAPALAQLAKAYNHELTAGEAQTLFDALAPLRDKQQIGDADLEKVTGGFSPGRHLYFVYGSESRI